MRGKYIPFIFCVVVVIIFTSSLLFSKSSLAAGSLFAYWKFDETVAGSTVVDSSGNGYNGTPEGPGGTQNLPQPSTDIAPVEFTDLRSLQFDGNDDYVDLPDWGIDMSGGFSISVWGKPTAVKNWARFIDFGNGPSNNNIVFGRLGGSDTLFFEIYDGASTTKVEATNTLVLNEWHLYVATVDENGDTVIYRDGVVMQSGSTNPPSALINRTTNYIGRSNWGGDQYYEGYMDDLRIYDRALTQTEVEELAEGEPGPDAPTPTPTPSPTPTPGSGSPGNSSTSSSNGDSCNAANIQIAPDLFQINTTKNTATLFFTPVSNASNYIVFYGLENSTNQHSVQTNQGNSTGVLSYTIEDLMPNTKYSFTVVAQNCNSIGNNSNMMTVDTKQDKIFYKNFLTQVINTTKPRQVTNVTSVSQTTPIPTKPQPTQKTETQTQSSKQTTPSQKSCFLFICW